MIPANILLTVNVIHADGIRMFLNTLTKKIEANCKMTFFCGGIINFLFDGLAYNTSGHFAHCSYFSSPLGGLGKNTTHLAKYPHVLYAKPSNKLYIYYIAIGFKILSEHPSLWAFALDFRRTQPKLNPLEAWTRTFSRNFCSLETLWKRGNVNTS